MQSLRPESAAVMTAHRREAIKLAKAQEQAVSDKCKRSGQEVPGYAFDELIGKGSFGRVYKGRQLATSKIVAIKVLDVDDADFQAFGEQKDEQIRDFNREIQILRRAQDSGAENLNQMIEALPVHSQLWLICEHCPGGSVKTLMRATNDRLAEKYLIVVARELAKALKGLHQAGIMHRDVKAANVLIHENGGLQLCDFGVAAALEGHADKRRTFIGTLHWMPPELWDDKPEYSDEVDVWGYGCTLYECALGRPPNSDVRERQQLKVRMRRLKQSLALPEKETFSDGLRSLVKFALNPDAASRPSMHDILQHEFLAGTEEEHPTQTLTELVQFYYGWLFSGGQRVSLFMPGGAAPASAVEDNPAMNLSDEWNFSMTQDFERRVSAILEIPDLSDISDTDYDEGEATPRGPAKGAALSPPAGLSAAQKANFELRVQRGADLSNLFDTGKPAYEYKTKTDFVPVKEPERRISDLPFRAMAEDRPSSIASNVIDLGDFDEADYAIVAPRTDDRIQTAYAANFGKDEQTFKLADAATLRAKRANSKGPADPNNLTIRQGFTSSDGEEGSPQEWTIKDRTRKPELQEAAEINPTPKENRAKPRDTMGWSFADAMNEMSSTGAQTTSAQSPMTIAKSGPSDAELKQKAQKHTTLDWSFSMAMAEAGEQTQSDDEEASFSRSSAHTRPAPLLRMMTQPVTSHEVHDAYDDDDIPRPSTAMSEAHSISSASSTDFDPFALDHAQRSTWQDEDEGMPGEAEIDELGVSEFYTTRGTITVPQGFPQSAHATTGSNVHDGLSAGPYPMGLPIRIGEEGFPGPVAGNMLPVAAATAPPSRSPRSPPKSGHTRANGSMSGRGSGSSVGSAKMLPGMTNGAGGPGGSAGSRASTAASSRVINLPTPAPPSLAAMSGDASAETLERELERLLAEFHGALGVAGDVIGDGVRGRARRRRAVGESGDEWEDEE